MSFRLGVISRNAAADGLAVIMNTGLIEIYTGDQPSSIDDSPAGIKLGTCVFSPVAFNAASNGTIVANQITSDSSADDSGPAGYFRVRDASNSYTIADGTCGQGSGDLSFDNNIIVSGGIIDITGFSITVPM